MDAELDAAAAELQALAQQLQRALDELAARGALTEQAVLEARRAFDAQVLVLMARHMRAVPGQVSGMWDVRAVAAMPVGEVTLSQALYANARQVAREAGAIVRQHAQGVQQSRELALRLYDGYDPKDGLRRPLEGTARARLPKALRQLTADAADRASLQRVFDLGMRYAATLKTAPLKAAYMEALRGWEDQQGAQALRRRLAVAVREKSRFMANRIAQTELARAHQHALADELMADASIEVVQVVLSGSHPRRDICDLHARADLFGLGPGCYPTARAPRPTFHPFCRCRLRSRPDLSASMARIPRGGEEAAQRAWLRELPEGEAAQVMGSRSLLQQVLTGADPVEIVNRGVPQAYRTMRLGEVAQSPAMSDAYEIAKGGGKHHGFLAQLSGYGDRQRSKAAGSFQEQVDLHLDKIAHPEKYVDNWAGLREAHRTSILREWRKEVLDRQEQIEILKGYEDEHP